MRARVLNALLGAIVALGAGCALAPSEGDPVGDVEQEAQPIDRLLIGQAAKYPADRKLRERNAELDANMKARRAAAWTIVSKVLAPVTIAARPNKQKAKLPRFQTWYSKDDVLPMFDRLFRALPESQRRERAPFAEKDIAAVFPWNAKMAPSLESYTKEREDARRKELENALGLHSLGKNERTLMSPEYVAHVLRSYREIIACNAPAASVDLEPTKSFAPCLAGEFPVDAAAIKARWMPGGAPLPTFDTSKDVVASKVASGAWGEGDATAEPSDDDIYTMRLTEETTMRLAALHIMTKELRDWAWITLWWSDDPDTDFGADRPASIKALGEPWQHYKMCVVTSYDEKDPSAQSAPGKGPGPASWCSNPYLEIGERAAKTSCIGCHQNGGTGETGETVLADANKFPDNGRTKIRKNFPADYTFTTSTGLELGAGMSARIEALDP